MKQIIKDIFDSKKLIIVCAGDSITQQNYHLNGHLNYVGHLSERLKHARIINAGVDGDDTEGLLMRFEDDVARFHPDFVTIMIGINDSKYGIENISVFEKNMMMLIERVNKINASLLLITQNPIISTVQEDNVIIRNSFPEYVNRIRDIANRCNIPLCDINKIWKKHISDNPQEKWLLMSDPVHPNEYGQKFMADILFQYLHL